jgi:hypothetical protein
MVSLKVMKDYQMKESVKPEENSRSWWMDIAKKVDWRQGKS